MSIQIRMRGTKAECEERIKRLSLLETRATVVYEDGQAVGMEVEAWW